MASHDAAFPAGFLWGAATSAYQIEGAVSEGGRGESIWDVFSHFPGNTANGDTGDHACDSYRRFPEDIRLMQELGLTSYRFSIAWPRIMPTGSGAINQTGLDYYRRLIDALLAADIAPMATLYHWDLPRPLQSRGGWTNRDTAERFAEYAQIAVRALGDGVHRWVTINEPWVAAFLGHLLGIHAPGQRDLRAALAAAHTLLLAHGMGLEALRAEFRPGDEAGIALNLGPVQPAGDGAADLEAADRADGLLNRWFLDALYRGAYPSDMVDALSEFMPEMQNDDMRLISAPTDFLAINYYTRQTVEWVRGGGPFEVKMTVPPDAPVTAMGWEVYPHGLFETLTRVHEEYAPGPLYITENGAAYEDRLIDGAVDDPERERYLHEHLLAALRAIADGVPLKGYYVWSLLDNFEWSLGYSKRFGVVHVDFATQERTIKRSGRWYAEVTRENAVPA